MKTILIVDDSASIRQAVTTVLTSAGFEVVPCADGQEALAKLDGRKIHLIISDINMPVMDGITMTRELKKMPLYKFTPVIMLTNEFAKDKEAGVAKAWVVKPFQQDQLLSAVTKLVLP